MSDSDRPPGAEPSLPALFGRLTMDAVGLMAAEVRLLKVEASQRARLAGDSAVPAGLLLVTATIGLLCLTAALILALGPLIGYALSCAAVGVALLFVALLAGLTAKGRFERVLAPLALPQPSSQAELPPGEGGGRHE